MKTLLTGGSGDVGTLVARDLLSRGDQVVNVDMAAPKISGGTHIPGSILDRALLARAMQGVDCVVHIAAWHGIHETTKTPADFHDLNVTGTFNVLQAAADAGVKKFVFISSTSVRDETGLYGASKLAGEKMAQDFAQRHGMDVVILRPRAFIPNWNRAVYKDFLQWAAWFMRGAVHVDDFKDAVLRAIDMTPDRPAPIYTIDGAYDYSADEFKDWDKDGAGTSFAKKYPAFLALAKQHGLDIAKMPRALDIPPEQKMPGYAPKYSMKNLLEELQTYGTKGPPAPLSADIKTNGNKPGCKP